MSEPTLQDRFHLIGIGGAGMSVVAELLASRGATVEGSDREESAVLEHLRSVGVRAFVGHEASHVDPSSVVVVSTAIREDNPELAIAHERGQRRLLALRARGRGASQLVLYLRRERHSFNTPANASRKAAVSGQVG